MTTACQRLAASLVVDPEEDDDYIVVTLDEVDLVDSCTLRVARRGSGYRRLSYRRLETRAAARHDGSRRSSVPPLLANAVARQPRAADLESPRTEWLAATMAALVLLVAIAILVNPAL